MSEPKFTIQAVYKGFPLSVEMTGTAERLEAVINRLLQIGATGPESRGGHVLEGTTEKPSAAPSCPIHRMKMRQSGRGGYYCPRKLANGGYCEEKARAA